MLGQVPQSTGIREAGIMTTELALLPQTTITAKAPMGWAQVVIENTDGALKATLRANAGGKELGPIVKELEGKAGALAKAGLVGPLLKQGLDHLAAKQEDNPKGLPIEIVVGEKGQQFKHSFNLPLNLNAMGTFMQIVGMIRQVNAMAGER